MSSIYRLDRKYKGQVIGPPGPIGPAGVIVISSSFSLPINAAEVGVSLVGTDGLEDGQSFYGVLPGNITAKLRRSGTQYFLKSLFKLSSPIAFAANSKFYASGELSTVAIATDVTIAINGATTIQIEPNNLAEGAKLVATVGSAVGVISRGATTTTFTPNSTLPAALSLVAFVDSVVVGSVKAFEPKASTEVVVNRPSLSAFISENLYRLPDGAGLRFQGFSSPGDIAMPPYIWRDGSTLADDGVAIVKPTHITGPGRAIIQHNGFIHAEWFGGKTSDAVQKAINSIDRGTVYLCPGQWNWTSAVIIKKDIQIVGSGNATVLYMNNLPDTALFVNDYTINESCTGVAFRNFEVLDEGPQRTRTIYHFALANTFNIYFEGIYFTAMQQNKDSKSGVYLFQSQPLTQSYGSFVARIHRCIFNVAQLDIRITDCYITETAVWGNWLNYAIHVGKPSIMISNCMITGPSSGPSRAAGIWIEDTDSASRLSGINIEGCYFDGSYPSIDPVVGIYIGGGGISDSRIINNWIWHQDKAVIINADTYALIIANNSFQGNGRRPATAEPDIYIAAAANFRYSQIHNNTFTREETIAQSGPALAIYAASGALGTDLFNYVGRNTVVPNIRYAADAIAVPSHYIISENIDGSTRGTSGTRFYSKQTPATADRGGFYIQVDGAVNSVQNAVIGGMFASSANGMGSASIQGWAGAFSDAVGWAFHALVANARQLILKLDPDGTVAMPLGLIQLGTRFLWFDSSGNLRTSGTRPTNRETDGVIVGTQT